VPDFKEYMESLSLEQQCEAMMCMCRATLDYISPMECARRRAQAWYWQAEGDKLLKKALKDK
jgi:hypothetical protein